MSSHQPWKVLVVDDDEGIHSITRMVFRGYTFEDRPIELLNALSAAQAQQILETQSDIAVAILDVVMETDQAGLDLVNHIRETLQNTDMRIILRTGHPGFAPEADVIIEYDINDYLSKAELSASRLLTSVVVALRSYRDLLHKQLVTSPVLAVINTDTQLNQPELSSVRCLSEKLSSQLQPLKNDLSKLQKINHKPMAQILVQDIVQSLELYERFYQQFIPLPPTLDETTTLVDILNELSLFYLPQARSEGWIVDYHLGLGVAEGLKLPHKPLLLLMTSAMALSIHCAKGNDIQLDLESTIEGIVVHFKIKGYVRERSQWVNILIQNLNVLSARANTQVMPENKASCISLLLIAKKI